MFWFISHVFFIKGCNKLVDSLIIGTSCSFLVYMARPQFHLKHIIHAMLATYALIVYTKWFHLWYLFQPGLYRCIRPDCIHWGWISVVWIVVLDPKWYTSIVVVISAKLHWVLRSWIFFNSNLIGFVSPNNNTLFFYLF